MRAQEKHFLPETLAVIVESTFIFVKDCRHKTLKAGTIVIIVKQLPFKTFGQTWCLAIVDAAVDEIVNLSLKSLS
jgi:uncharacterized Zn ribbon protein